MNILFLTLPILLSGTAPGAEANPDRFIGPDVTWSLSTLNDAPFEQSATLTFAENGVVAGKAPCNSYTGQISGTPDSFTIGPLAVTRMMCPNLEAESTYIAALEKMTSAAASDESLTLSDGEGSQMVFVVSPVE